MFKENLVTIIPILFFGILIIYLNNTPPTIIFKHPNISEIKNIIYFEEDEDNGLCKK